MTSENHASLHSSIKSDQRMGALVAVGQIIALLAGLFSFVFIILSFDKIDFRFGIAVIILIVSIIVSRIAYGKQSEYIVSTRLKIFSRFYESYKALDVYLQTNNQGKKNKAVKKINKIIEKMELWNNEDLPKAFLSETPQLMIKDLKEKVMPTLKNANIESIATKTMIQKLRTLLFDMADKISEDEPSIEEWCEFNKEIHKFNGGSAPSTKKRVISISTLLMILLAGGPILGIGINPILIEKGTSEGDSIFQSIVIAIAWMAFVGPFIIHFYRNKM